MHVDHLNGFKFLQHSPRGQARSKFVESTAQSYMQTVSEEGDENMSFDALFVLMVNRADR
jgi:hypothetical protein